MLRLEGGKWFHRETNDSTVMGLINTLKSGENLFEYTPSTIRSSKSIYSFNQ